MAKRDPVWFDGLDEHTKQLMREIGIGEFGREMRDTLKDTRKKEKTPTQESKHE